MKKINICNLAFLIAILISDVFYLIFDSVLIKALASILFVALGLINVICAHKKGEKYMFSYIILIGLFFAFLGDVVLEFQFIIGAALFAIGHVFFFVSYCIITKFHWKDLIYGVAIFIPSVLIITLVPLFDFGGLLMEMVCIVYALIISLMVGKSISNFVRMKNKQNLVILIGSILFFFSDFMLLFNVFASTKVLVFGISLFGILCLGTYYPAEFLLAHSILYKEEK